LKPCGGLRAKSRFQQLGEVVFENVERRGADALVAVVDRRSLSVTIPRMPPENLSCVTLDL
jgi:hypothetical protein